MEPPPPGSSSPTAKPRKVLRPQQLVLQSSSFPAGCLCGPQGLAQVLGMFTLWLRRFSLPEEGCGKKLRKSVLKTLPTSQAGPGLSSADPSLPGRPLPALPPLGLGLQPPQPQGALRAVSALAARSVMRKPDMTRAPSPGDPCAHRLVGALQLDCKREGRMGWLP